MDQLRTNDLHIHVIFLKKIFVLIFKIDDITLFTRNIISHIFVTNTKNIDQMLMI